MEAFIFMINMTLYHGIGILNRNLKRTQKHKKSLIERDNGYTKEDYEKEVKELRADIGYEHPIMVINC